MGAVQTTVLKVRFEPENFNAGRTAFQGLANDTKAASGAISTINTDLSKLTKSTDAIGSKIKQNVTTPLQEVDKTTTSVGAKLQNFGKKFAGSVANVGALGTQVFNLSRQYQDLSDSQIRVDRTALKMSKTTEAAAKARAKLNQLVASGVTSGAEYEQAVTDVQQAEEAATLAVTMNKEALEDQQRAYENFAMNLVPTVVSAGGTLVNLFKDLGGTKGISGLISKLKGGGGISSLTGALANLSGGGPGGLGGLISKFKGAEGGAGSLSKAMEFLKGNIAAVGGALAGIAGAAIILEIGAKAQAILDKMSTSDVGRRGGIIQAALGDPEQIKIQSMAIAEYDAIVKNTDIRGIDLLYDAIFGAHTVENAAKSAGILDKQGKILKDAAVAAIDLGGDFKMSASQYEDAAYNMLVAGKSVAQVSDYLTKESFIPQEKAVVILDAALAKYNATLKETGQGYQTMQQALSQKAITDTFFPPNTKQAIVEAATKQLGTSGKTIVAFMEKEIQDVKNAGEAQKLWQAIFGDAKTAQGEAEKFGNYGKQALDSLKEKMKTLFEGELFDPTFGDKLAAFGEKGNAALARISQQMINAANSAKYLDANLKLLPQTLQQQASALQIATNGLNQHEQATRTAAEIGVDLANSWITQTRDQAVQNEAMRKTLAEKTQAMYGDNIAMNQSVEFYKLLIEAQELARAGSMDLAKKKLEEARAIDTTTKAASRYTLVVGGGTVLNPKVAKQIEARGGNVPTYTYFPSKGKPQKFYGSTGPQLRPKPKQHGFEGVARKATLFMAGEGGRRERVSVHPIGSASDRGGRAGGNEGFVGKVQLIIGDGSFEAWVRRVANSGQGTFR